LKPYVHAVISAKKYGGVPEDYLEIHNFMDSSKSALADVRHRAIFHSAFGIFIVEKVFGTTLRNSDDKTFSVRDIAEDHVMDDLGFIPTLEHWLRNMRTEPWMAGHRRKQGKHRVIELNTEEDIVKHFGNPQNSHIPSTLEEPTRTDKAGALPVFLSPGVSVTEFDG
jgi:hypothetical protein